jgi:hypothetical protein
VEEGEGCPDHLHSLRREKGSAGRRGRRGTAGDGSRIGDSPRQGGRMRVPGCSDSSDQPINHLQPAKDKFKFVGTRRNRDLVVTAGLSLWRGSPCGKLSDSVP